MFNEVRLLSSATPSYWTGQEIALILRHASLYQGMELKLRVEFWALQAHCTT